MHHYIHSRRRSITFNGRTIVISAALREGAFGNDKRNSFAVSRVKGVSNVEPGATRPGRLHFDVDGGSGAVLENPAGGGDKIDMTTFCYNAIDRGQVRRLVADIKAVLAAK